MIRIDAGCCCESRTIYVHLRGVYKKCHCIRNLWPFPQACLHHISLAMLELKYRSPPGTFQFECVVHALDFFHRFWSKHISAALKKSNLTYEGPLQVVCRDKIFSLVSLSA
jgi:hypothetical protein